MRYQYAISFFRDDGSALAQIPVTPDWGPALEWLQFEGMRAGLLPAVTAAARGTVEPVWHPQIGQPCIAGVRAVASARDRTLSREIPRSYFRALASQAANDLVHKGVLTQGEVFRYSVNAYPAPQPPAREGTAVDFAVEEVLAPLPLEEAPLESFFSGAVPAGSAAVDGDVPVFISEPVLDELTRLARQAGDCETGGVLVGTLRRDSSVPEIFVEIAAQIAATHTESSSTKLTFTAETWAAVRAAIALRKRSELMIGWWHYHPDFCRLKNCPVERRRTCTLSSAFFSAEDVHLHRTCFPRAYQVAVLISDSTAEGLTQAMYGWRQGMVAERGMYVVERQSRVDSQKMNHQEEKEKQDVDFRPSTFDH
jgi:proteasome lid subunit RPN8/RPN11